jgi:hypothetical protein
MPLTGRSVNSFSLCEGYEPIALAFPWPDQTTRVVGTGNNCRMEAITLS